MSNADIREIRGLTYSRQELHSALLGQTVGLGFLKPNGRINGTVYVLHGGIGDDRFTMDIGLPEAFPEQLMQTLRDRGLQFVMPYVGRSFLHDHPGSSARAFSSYFTQEVLPRAEAGTETNAASRFLSGYSMGGRAALSYFARHASKFAGVAAMFPTLIDFDYSSQEAIAAFSKRNGVVGDALTEVVSEFTAEFVGGEDYASHDPIHLLAKLPEAELAGKTIEFGCGDHDEYGLHEGCRRLHQLLTERGLRHGYEELSGGKHDLDALKGCYPRLVTRVLA